MIKSKRYQLPLALAFLGASAVTIAATDTFTVSATVGNACVISATDMDFGSIDVTSGQDITSTSELTVTCTSGAAYEIALSAGAGGDVSTRAMSDGDTGTLNYGLFSDSSHMLNWGETEDADTVADTGNGSAQVHTVYGRIPSGQTGVAAGTYTDTIIATVIY
jgi:spore coat protein U-like protein